MKHKITDLAGQDAIVDKLSCADFFRNPLGKGRAVARLVIKIEARDTTKRNPYAVFGKKSILSWSRSDSRLFVFEHLNPLLDSSS